MIASIRNSSHRWIAIALLVLGAALRLYDLTDQPIDFHPTRQLRGAIVARGIYYQLLPNADEDLRRAALNFKESTGSYEPPILETAAALTYLAAGREIFWSARVINTLLWLVGGLALLGLTRRVAAALQADPNRPEAQRAAWISGLVSLGFYLALPFSVQASRSIQPDPGMVVWTAVAIYGIWRWSETHSWKWAVAAGAAAGVAILTKAVIVFTLTGGFAAICLYSTWERSPQSTASRHNIAAFSRAIWRLITDRQIWLVAGLAVLPTAAYYLTRQDRASEYFSSWTLALSHLLLRPSFYVGWLYLVLSLITPAAMAAVLIGLLRARGRAGALFIGLWGGYILYGLFLPYQMDTHNYYHLQVVYLTSVTMIPMVLAAVEAFQRRTAGWRIAAGAAAVVLLVLASRQALVPFYSRDYRSEPAYWQTIASYLPGDGKIIALTQDYGYRLMYYGWRKVTLWPNRGEIRLNDLRGSSKEFDEFFAKRTHDKSFFLITAFRQYDDQPVLQKTLTENYAVAAEGPGYLIFDLTRRPQAVH